MKFKIIAASIFLSLLFSGCGGAKASPSNKTDYKSDSKPQYRSFGPKSHQATFIESSSSSEIMIRVTGMGNSMKEASKDAKLVAVWFALSNGNNPILQTPAEKNSFKAVGYDIYKNSSKYITHSSGIKGKRKNAGKYLLDYVIRVDIASIKSDLIEKGVLKETAELLGDLDLPEIAVVLKSKKDVESNKAVNVISEYLSDRDFEVKHLDGNEAGKMFLKIAQSISNDPVAIELYAKAISSGSDIYITLEVDKSSRDIGGNEVKKASVSAHAYYTASGKEIAATSGYSQERVVSSYSSVIAEATNDAANKLLSQIQKSWKKEAKRGKSYKVIVTTPNNMVRKVEAPLYKALKATCKAKPKQSIGNIFDYILQCKDIANYMDLEMEIKGNYAGPGQVFKEAAKGAFIVLKIANSEEEEIEIE